jgi:hypothetical protein
MEINQATRVHRSGKASSASVKRKSRTSVQLSGSTMRKEGTSEKLPPLKVNPRKG